MSSGATPQPSTVVWPMDGPPVAPSITYVSTETLPPPLPQIPIPPAVVTPSTIQPTTGQPQTALEAQLAAIASMKVPGP